MGIRKYKPTTPGRRGSSVADFVEITRTTPEKSLVASAVEERRAEQRRSVSRRGTRAAATSVRTGSSTSVGYDKDGVPAKVAHIEYDPNRTARIALLHYADGEKRYILAPNKLSQGDAHRERPVGRHQAGQQPARCATSRSVRSMHRHRAPPRRRRQDRPFRGRQRCSSSRRTAPTRHAASCRPARSATSTSAAARPIGEVGNAEQSNINWGKAGRMRWKGKSPDRPRCRHEPHRPPARWW